MAKPAASEAGMDKAEMKQHLRLARAAPIMVAFAFDESGKAVVQMDRRKSGKQLERMLKDEAPGAKNSRWGTAAIDPDDGRTVLFTVNKAGGGMARKLSLALKGTGFSKVRVVLEDGTELEAHGGEDEEEAGERNGGAEEGQARAPERDVVGARAPERDVVGARAPERDGVDARAPERDGDHNHGTDHGTGRAGRVHPGAAETGESFAAGAAAVGAMAGAAAKVVGGRAEPDATGLAHDLTGLVKRMLVVIAKDPAQKAALAEMATDAQASLRRGDLAQAGAGLDILRESLGDIEAQIAGAHPGGDAAQGAPEATAAAAKQILARLTQVVKQAMPNTPLYPGLAHAIKTTVPAVQEHVKSGDLEAARQALAGLEQRVAQVEGTPTNGAQGRRDDDILGDRVPGAGHDAHAAPAAQTAHAGQAAQTAHAGQAAPAAHASNDAHADHTGQAAPAAHAGQAAPAAHTGQAAPAAHTGQAAPAAHAGQAASAAHAGQAALAAHAGQAALAAHAGHEAHAAHAAKHAPVIDTAIKVWTATRRKIEGEVEDLHKAFHTALDGHGMMDDLAKAVRTQIDGTIRHFDESLSHTLTAINQASAPAERATHVESAHAKIQHYLQHVASDAFALIDKNPFRPTNIRKLVETTLTSLSKSIR